MAFVGRGINTVRTVGNQSINGDKTFNDGLDTTGAVSLSSTSLIIKKQSTVSEGGQINFEKADDSVLKTNPYIDLYQTKIRFNGRNSSNGATNPLSLDFESNIAYANNSDVVGSIVTTSGIVKSGNGYIKFGNGIIIQWGSNVAAQSGSTITFPTPFSTINYKIVGSFLANVGRGDQVLPEFYNYTTTGCSFRSQQNFAWFTVGY